MKRDGKYLTINAGEVVPGDIVCLGAGGSVPADCKLLAGKPVQVFFPHKQNPNARWNHAVANKYCVFTLMEHATSNFKLRTP